MLYAVKIAKGEIECVLILISFYEPTQIRFYLLNKIWNFQAKSELPHFAKDAIRSKNQKVTKIWSSTTLCISIKSLRFISNWIGETHILFWRNLEWNLSKFNYVNCFIKCFLCSIWCPFRLSPASRIFSNQGQWPPQSG